MAWPDLAAAVVNAGFWAVLGFGTLGKALWMVITKSALQRDPEAGLAIGIVGIPCSVVATAVFLVYWLTWREADQAPPDAAKE